MSHSLTDFIDISPRMVPYIHRHVSTTFIEADGMPDFIERVVNSIIDNEPAFCGYISRENAIYAGILVGRYIQRNETAHIMSDLIQTLADEMMKDDTQEE